MYCSFISVVQGRLQNVLVVKHMHCLEPWSVYRCRCVCVCANTYQAGAITAVATQASLSHAIIPHLQVISPFLMCLDAKNCLVLAGLRQQHLTTYFAVLAARSQLCKANIDSYNLILYTLWRVFLPFCAIKQPQ